MAGIGFELKKLFKATGVLSMLKAYGYTGMVTVGPMLLGFSFLLAISSIAKWAGIPKEQSDLLVSMITYTLMASMIYSGIFSMVMTRYVADLLYEEKNEDVLPSLEGILCILLPLGGVLWLVFIVFSGLDFTLSLLVFTLFMELTAAWTEMNYLSAIKDYKGILLAYVASISAALLISIGGSYLFGGSVELMMLSVVVGYGIMMTLDMSLLYRFFPNSGKRHFYFLPWFDEYSDLIVIGLATNIGLFGHLVIAWFSPIGEPIKGLFYSAPQHDVAALFAFLTILITTINFVASVEVNLYPKYRRYYDLFNGTGSISEIEQAENEMLTVLEHELIYTARRQFYGTALMLSVGLVILGRLPLGFDAMMEGYFRTLCVGYGAYAVGNVLTLILMYFTDYEDTKRASIIFALTTTIGSLVSTHFDMRYYGFAFAFGSLIYMVVAIWMLSRYTKRLPYHILSTQPLLAERKYGLGSRIFEKILAREKKEA
jgi:uncharacterized membrane protein